MPTPSEVQRKAIRVNSVYDELCRGKDRCQGYAYNSSDWWQSEAGKALRSQYSEIQADITRLISKLGTVVSSIKRLSTNIQNADDERRRKAEELKRQALNTKKK